MALAEWQPSQVGVVHIQLVSQTSWYAPAQVVGAELQRCQVGEAAQIRRYLPAQPVVAEVQRFKFGSVKAKSDTGQVNEVLLKFLCHNICVLIQEMHELGITSAFGAGAQEFRVAS